MRGDEHKLDHGKLMYDLIPERCIEGLAKILTFGAKKYAPNGWKSVPDKDNRYYAAMQRHIIEHRKGNIYDDETGYLHLEHALCNIVFLLQTEYERLEYNGKDERDVDQRTNHDGWNVESQPNNCKSGEQRPDVVIYHSSYIPT